MEKQLFDYEEEIQPIFNRVIQYSQDWDDKINTDIHFDTWAKNKQWFYERMNHQLIVEGPVVELKLSAESKEKKFIDFCHDFNTSVYSNYTEMKKFLGSISVDEFFNNSLNSFYTFTLDNGETKTIPSGMKVLRAFKYFLPNEKVIRYWQDIASMIIQEDKIRGNVCLSIHPLDYLSISENASDWRSCHALNGEHRAGNLAYMMDSSTIVAYIKSDKGNVPISRFPSDVPWNNKKWRSLLFFSDTGNMIFAGRPYPFACDLALETLTELMKSSTKLMDYHNGWSQKEKWRTGEITNVTINEKDAQTIQSNIWGSIESYLHGCLSAGPSRLIFAGGTFKTIGDLMGPYAEYLLYNDLLWSSVYFPYHILGDYANISTQKFNIGIPVPCLKCGITLQESESLECEDCNNTPDPECYCSMCDDPIMDTDDAYYLDWSDEWVCSCCYNVYTANCARCNKRVPKSALKYNESFDCELCENCQDKLGLLN